MIKLCRKLDKRVDEYFDRPVGKVGAWLFPAVLIASGAFLIQLLGVLL